jgi:hypothetical protein
MKYIILTLSLASLALATPTSPLAPLSKRGEVIDDSYIVVFKKDVNPQQMAIHLAGLEEWHQADVSLSSFFPSSSLSLLLLYLSEGFWSRLIGRRGTPLSKDSFVETLSIPHSSNVYLS